MHCVNRCRLLRPFFRPDSLLLLENSANKHVVDLGKLSVYLL
jgi:hypothetical protein